MSLDMVTRYELEKELGIQKVFVADLDSKNRALREIASASEREKAGLEEQLSVKAYEYSEALRIMNESLTSCRRQVVEAMKIMTADEVKLKTQRETYDVYIEDLQGKLDTQKDVFEGVEAENTLLTGQVERLREERKDLKAQIRDLRYRAGVTEKLEKVLQQFEP